MGDLIVSIGIFAVGIVTGALVYHIVCEVKIRHIRLASEAWHEEQARRARTLDTRAKAS